MDVELIVEEYIKRYGRQSHEPKSKKQSTTSPQTTPLSTNPQHAAPKEAAEESQEDSDTEQASFARCMSAEVKTVVDVDVNHLSDDELDTDVDEAMEGADKAASKLEQETMRVWAVG